MEKLNKSRVAIFGLGGVGGYVAEALARSGVGALDLIDHDKIERSNLNRQIIATEETLGKDKVDAARDRILQINPACNVTCYKTFAMPENIDTFPYFCYRYVVDAIDTVTGKLAIIERAYREHIPVISAMGAGNKLDPTKFEVADIFKTSVCPLARVMRRELKKRGVDKLKVVYSKEEPKALLQAEKKEEEHGKIPPASVAFVPSVMGLIIAGEVIKDLIEWQEN